MQTTEHGKQGTNEAIMGKPGKKNNEAGVRVLDQIG
jgi:hypothetical protein